MVAIAITSIIFLPRHLSSQTSTNLPLVLASGEQLAPALVSDGLGGAFAIWHDKRDNRTAIYAQRLNTLSQPLWKPDGILIATSPKDQLALTAITDGKNGVLIFWQDLRNDAGDIYGQRVDASGNLLWSATGVEVNRASGKQSEPQAVSDGEGGAFVVWHDFKSGNEDVMAQRLDMNGKIFFEPAGRAVTLGLGYQTLGDVVAAHDGGFVVVWNDKSAGLARVAAQRFDAKANPLWTAPALVTAIRSTQAAPAVYFNAATNNTFVVWIDDRNRNDDIFMQKIDAAGLPQWGLTGAIVCKASNTQANPKIIGDGGDGVLVAWEDQRSGKTDIYAQALNAAGQTRWSSDGVGIVITSQEQTQPEIIPDGSGGLICVWSDERNSGTNIAAQRLDKNGKALWEANGIFITPEGGAKQHPAVLAAPAGSNGNFVVWEDSRRGNEDIFAQLLNSDGAPANVPPIISSTPITEAQAGSLYNYQVKALDYDSSDPLRLELAAPIGKWLQVDNNKLQLFGTPGVNDAGEIAVTIAIKDKLGAQATQSFNLKVIVTNRPPQITSKPDTIATEDQLYNYQIVASDPDPGDALTYALETDATWLKLTTGNKLTGTPANDHVGNYMVTLRVTDKLGFATTQKFSLRVKNVNDPPSFTSQPDTVASVDSLYIYRPTTADIDRSDVVQIIKRAAPEWLSWNTNTRTLQGRPNSRQAGTVHLVNLQARDAAGAAVEQNFRLRVISLAPLDVTAPAAPQAVQIEPAAWSANKKFTLRWQNPFDPSRITGAYYKIGAAPAHNQDGVFVASSDGVTIDQLDLLATREGQTPIYLWLVDGRGNVDFRTSANVSYRYDATPPAAPENLAPHLQWNRGDSLLLKWTPSTDAISGILRYHFFLDGNFVEFVNGSAGSFTPILQLSEGSHGWTFMAEDSAGNLSQRVGASFKVDRTPPALQHSAADTTLAGSALELSMQANDALAGIREAQIYYRAAGETAYRNKNLQNAGAASFTIRLEAAEIPAEGLQYFFEAADSAGNRGRWPIGAPANFQSLAVNSASVAAPAAFIANRYQLFSVPYLLVNDSPAQLLEDDLGSYDQTVWRLFRYQQDQGNVELGKPNFENFAPGRAYWLITTTPKNFDAGPARSLRTDAPFALKLQPGWNLIATPFDFPTAWSAAGKPESVENNLWAFDGAKYLDQQKALLPWQGYFLRNLDSQPQTINIAPVPENGVNKIRSEVESPKSEVIWPNWKIETSLPEISWKVQLQVSDGDFSDEANYFGVAPAAAEHWDPLDLSEPPTIGEHVSLYFDHHDWPRFGGKFTRDFRPASDAAQQWPFEIVASRPGLPVELHWNLSGDFPTDWILLLQDVDGNLRREIRPREFHHAANYIFRATAQPRRFIWWAGKKEQLAEAGALQNLIPAAFELTPSYPNPLRLTELPQIGVIRFGLPNANAVRLTIFDLAGRTVRTLLNGENLNAGYHEVQWNGRDHAGRLVTAGIYIYRLEAANFSASHKLILLR
jgi:hypothetical protein